MTRKYEIVYILDSALEESQINEVLDTLHELLKTPDTPEPVTDSTHWGKRTLAYEIAGKAIGYYVIARFETVPTALTEFERRLKLEDRILRYLLVVDEGLKPLTVPSEGKEPDTAPQAPEKPMEPDTAPQAPEEPVEAAAPTGEDA